MDIRSLTDAEIEELKIDQKLYSLHTALPAFVEAVNLDEMTVDAKIALKLRTNNNGQLGSLEYPILKNIPFFTYQSGDYAITIPPKSGDVCLLIFSERETDNFLATGKMSEPRTVGSRKHDINDGFAIIGFNPYGKKIKNIDRNAITVRNIDNSIKIQISDNGISFNTNNSVVRLTKEGEVTIDAKKLSIFSQNLSFSGSSISINARNQLTLGGNSVVVSGGNHISMNGAVSVSGDFDVRGLRPKYQMSARTDSPATQGTLQTGLLDSFDELKTNLKDNDLEFNIEIANNTYNVHIDNSSVKDASDYDDLISLLNSYFSETSISATCELEEYPAGSIVFKTMKITTNGYGKDSGQISFMRNIAEIAEPTQGKLITGQLPIFEVFIKNLNDKGLRFNIIVSGISYLFEILPAISPLLSDWTMFVELLKLQHPDFIDIEFSEENNSLIFLTKESGYMKGQISFLRNTSSNATAAKLICEAMAISFEAFKNELINDFAISISINKKEKIFYLSKSEIDALSSFEELAEKLENNNNDIRILFNVNRFIFVTQKTGASQELSYLNNVDVIPAGSGILITGQLFEFSAIKEAMAISGLAFAIQCGQHNIEIEISPEESTVTSSYDDLAKLIIEKSDNVINVLFDKDNNCLKFETIAKGSVDGSISYLQSIDDSEYARGDYMLCGTELTGAKAQQGFDEINTIAKNCAEMIGGSEDSGAVLINGADSIYNTNSAEILRGTFETGATRTQGQDQQIITTNDSASMLKGTEATGANLSPGHDAGEMPELVPGKFDGKSTFTNDIEVNNIVVRESVLTSTLIVNDETNLNGKTNINDELTLKEKLILENGEIDFAGVTITSDGSDVDFSGDVIAH